MARLGGKASATKRFKDKTPEQISKIMSRMRRKGMKKKLKEKK